MANQDRTTGHRCNWTEESLFLWFDGDLPVEEAAAFAAHLDGCTSCDRDRRAYEDLFRQLSGLVAPAVPAGFDAAILSRVPALRPSVGRRLFGRHPEGRTGRPGFPAFVPRAFQGAALVAAVVVLALAWGAAGVDWSAVAGRAVQPVAHLGARVAADGALNLLGAVTVSGSLIEVAQALEPVGRSAVVVARAFQAEFLLASLLLALTALLGAVRLAAGSVVERGVRRVCLALSI